MGIMNYRKSVFNNYILGIGLSEADANVTKKEYDLIAECFADIPAAPEGKVAVLLDKSYTWAFVDKTAEQDEVTDSDYAEAGRILLGEEV